MYTRGSLEEHLSDAPQNRDLRRPANVRPRRFPAMASKWGTFVPGIYGNHPLMGKELANLPSFIGIAPYLDGERLDLEHGEILQHRRALDLHSAVLSRQIRWRTAAATGRRSSSSASPAPHGLTCTSSARP
ncbi:MAG: hypothetical protein IPK19_40590 [Chloroflexi bacterium]|nr:hypothetical protein [Chloroflexota bacterium]